MKTGSLLLLLLVEYPPKQVSKKIVCLRKAILSQDRLCKVTNKIPTNNTKTIDRGNIITLQQHNTNTIRPTPTSGVFFLYFNLIYN